ncbi:MAG: PAS domain-containing protein [Rhodocyclaceae bacterium]|nr:PAS domain-containing protein [Rhodocyclaceae bacterium]
MVSQQNPAVPAPSAGPSAGESERLAEAFRIFNQASEELATAYTQLQGQVAALTEELAAANGALRQQYQEKAALTERLSLLLDALPAGVVVLDGADRVLQANPAAGALLGADPAGGDWKVLSAALSTADGPDEVFTGAGRRLAMTVSALDSAGGRIVLLHDITEAQRLKAQAERNERLAAMGEMAAQLAHQLRTPLAAALLYAGNLENPDLPAASRTAIAGKTVERLKHLERLIRDMLLFARGEVLGREPIDAADLLRELGHTLEPLCRARGVSFGLSAGEPGFVFTGNRKALAGALTNLLENALQAVDAGGRVELSVRAGPGVAEFVVADTGRGLDPAAVARLFEPFFTTRAEGTGLGLAIARGVARAHGGDIRAESAPGVGTTFTLTVARDEEACAA